MTRRMLIVPAVLMSLALVTLPPASALIDTVVVASGPMDHAIDYRDGTLPSCEGTGAVTLAIDVVRGSATLVNADTGCAPGFSSIAGGCSGSDAGPVTCLRERGDVRITLTLASDGGFRFTWHEPAFSETMVGQLVRA